MSLIIAGRFDTFLQAEKVAQILYESNFSHTHVSLFFVGPPGRHAKYPIGGDVDSDIGADKAHKGATFGTFLGAITGALIGVAMFAFVKSPWILSAAAAAVGAWVGALLGAMLLTKRKSKNSCHPNETDSAADNTNKPRDSGVLIAIKVNENNKKLAVNILKNYRAADVEEADGQWENGDWTNFDPLKPPNIIV